mmetsp:Transcript_19908/g.29238  ORF Transcript_19908/g.29238 Transcript_19908/m.29238 type:complete len:123 (-) Transcript_19908:255-623(-)
MVLSDPPSVSPVISTLLRAFLALTRPTMFLSARAPWVSCSSVPDLLSSALVPSLLRSPRGRATARQVTMALTHFFFLKDKSEEEVNRMKLRELKNGRLAMLAFAGVVTQAGLGDATHSFPYF